MSRDLSSTSWLALAQEAKKALQPYLSETPLVQARALSERVGREVYLKLETRQPTGAYKVRPALFGVLRNLEAAKSQGVLTTSSGNFAQAVAWAARTLGVRATIVMTSDTAPYKVDRTRALGAEVVFCGTTFESRFETVARLEQERGGVVLHPFDSMETIAGDGTIALELLEQLPSSSSHFSVLAPASGGGMISGVAAVLQEAMALNCTGNRSFKIFGLQPEAGGAIARSLAAGKKVNVGKVRTIADALVASTPGDRNWELIQRHVERFALVSELEIAAGLRFLIEEEKIWSEPGGATAVAGLLARPDEWGSGPLVCVVTGANLDPARLVEVLNA